MNNNNNFNFIEKTDNCRQNNVQLDFIEQIKLLIKQQDFMLQLLVQVIAHNKKIEYITFK